MSDKRRTIERWQAFGAIGLIQFGGVVLCFVIERYPTTALVASAIMAGVVCIVCGLRVLIAQLKNNQFSAETVEKTFDRTRPPARK